MTVARRAIDRHAVVPELPAQPVDVIDAVREVTEIARTPVLFRIPVVGELELCIVVARRREEDERVPSLLVVTAPQFAQAQEVALETQRLVEIADAHHRMQVFHRMILVGGLVRSRRTKQRTAP